MREPNLERFFWAGMAWFWIAQFPFMVLVGNDWLFANLPFNWAVLIGLYAIAVPHLLALIAYAIAKHRYEKAPPKEPANV